MAALSRRYGGPGESVFVPVEEPLSRNVVDGQQPVNDTAGHGQGVVADKVGGRHLLDQVVEETVDDRGHPWAHVLDRARSEGTANGAPQAQVRVAVLSADGVAAVQQAGAVGDRRRIGGVDR
ncbi:hypothetical protein [Streptomyces sp. NPDC059278]|uniref:hypothetical protein n=1 Tax=Streptomyces sp. NPDC059278 TaxID=3346801 RepID=UPI00369514C6